MKRVYIYATMGPLITYVYILTLCTLSERILIYLGLPQTTWVVLSFTAPRQVISQSNNHSINQL